MILPLRVDFIFANSVKKHICNIKNSRLGHDLPTLVNDRMISPSCEGFIFSNSFKRYICNTKSS